MANVQEWKAGPHRIRLEGTDVVWFELVDVSEAKHASEIITILQKIAARGPFYLVTDFTQLKVMDPAVRERVGKDVKPEWILGCAYINASLVMKMAVKAMNTLMFLTGKTSFKGVFVNNEAEAREAISKFRVDRKVAA